MTRRSDWSPSLMAVNGTPSSVFMRITFRATSCPLILQKKKNRSDKTADRSIAHQLLIRPADAFIDGGERSLAQFLQTQVRVSRSELQAGFLSRTHTGQLSVLSHDLSPHMMHQLTQAKASWLLARLSGSLLLRPR